MNVFQNVMVDLETLGTRSDAAIVTIGAVAFNFDTSEILDRKFYVNINPDSAQQAGCSIDAGTIMFWMKQDKAAQDALISANAVRLPQALEQFTQFLQEIRASNPRGNLNFWANDPDFDAVILQNSYRLSNMAAPWQFWENRSCRTLFDLGKRYRFDVKKELPRGGTHHNAADDAEYQAQCVMAVQSMLDSHCMPA